MNNKPTVFADSDGPKSEIALTPKNQILSPISSLSFSNSNIISGNESGCVSSFDQNKGISLFSYDLHNGPVTSISSVVNNVVITGGFDGKINAYNFNTNKLNGTFQENKNAITQIIYNNPYHVFLSSSLDATVKVFNIDQNRSLNTIKDIYPITTFNWINSLCVTGNQNGEIKMYDINTNQNFYSKKIFGNSKINSVNNISHILIDMESNVIISSSKTEGILNVIDMRMNQSIFNSVIHKGSINYIGNDQDKGIIVTGGSDNIIKVININAGFKEIANMKTSSKITCGDMSNSFVCVGCEDGCLLGYDLRIFKCNFGYNCDEKGKLKCCKIIHNYNKIITGGDEGIVRELIF